MDKLALFEQVKRARDLIRNVNQSISESSRRQYESAFTRLVRTGKTPEEASGTSASFYALRAAWIYGYSSAIRTTLNEADVASRSGKPDTWRDLVDRLPKLCEHLERYRPDPLKQNLARGRIGQWSVEAEKRKRAGEEQVRHSKKARLSGLPLDWREKMFLALREDSQYRDIVATLSASGARPVEFESGVLVESDGVGLRFTIAGAKSNGGKFGQAERSFTIEANRTEIVYLSARVSAAGGRLLVKGHAGAISDRIRALSRTAFPLLKSTVSSYVFRHQVAADLKASGLEESDVSAVLGHSSDETKGRYGSARSARGCLTVKKVTATQPVKAKVREKIKALELSKSRIREIDRDPGPR